ncbi:hypothetical protein J3F83DRAFT_766070 [Trichoderma novae-zelandiae]
MDSRENPATDDAGTQETGNQAFPRGQASSENPSGTCVDGTAHGHALIYDHDFDPSCPDCQRRTFELLSFQSYAPPGGVPTLFSNTGQPFAEFPTMSMADDAMFQSLSDFEDVTFFNQPYLLHSQEEGQLQFQHQHQHQHQQHQLDFSSAVIPPEFSASFDAQHHHQDEAVEPPRFYYDPPSVESSDFSGFNFNTLPYRPAQQPITNDTWMPAHQDSTPFASAAPETIKTELDVHEATGIAITLTQPTEVMTTTPQTRASSMLEPTAVGSLAPPSRTSHAHPRPPRRLLPAVSSRRPVHRQPEVRARRSPAIQMSPQAAAERAAKDRFLVQSRREGISYKDIKRLGNFTEAESTLRGRHRTLTKAKKDRQRDPKWTDLDIHLLKEAVLVLAHGQHPDRAKLSWMAVSVYIKEHGGYAFGYSTCHRRWAHLESAGQLGDTAYDENWEDEDDEDHTDEGYGESQADELEHDSDPGGEDEGDEEDEGEE